MVDFESVDVLDRVEHLSSILEGSGSGANQVIAAGEERYLDLIDVLDADVIRKEPCG